MSWGWLSPCGRVLARAGIGVLARMAELIVERAARWEQQRQLLVEGADEAALERTGYDGRP